MTVEELKVVITANTKSVKSEVEKVKSKFKTMTDEASKSASKITKGFASAGKAVAKAGKTVALGIGAGVLAIGTMAIKSAETTDRIDKLSQKLGLSKKGFQEWDYVLSQNGASIESMKIGMQTLGKRMSESVEGTGAGAEAFSKLGISATDSSGKMKSQEVIFGETVTALQGMKDGAEKNVLAQELLGKSGQELAPLLNGTADSVNNLKQKANDLGLVLSDASISAGVKFTDQMDTMKRSLGGVVAEIGVELMPIFAKMLNWITSNMPQIKSTMSKVFKAIKDAVKLVIDIVKKLVETFKTVSNWIKDHEALMITLATLLGSIALAFGLVTGAIALWTAITTVATAIGTAFGAMIAFITSPIGVVVLAIAAAIAIGVLLYKNWDKVTAFAKSAWTRIKNTISIAVDRMKSKVVGVWNSISSTTRRVFNSIKTSIMNPINSAVSMVRRAVAKIKGFFRGLRIKLPHIRLPHFRLRGSFSLVPPRVPRLSVNWYAKGGVFNSPTTIGVGENGSEAVMPLENNTGWIDTLASKLNGMGGSSNDRPLVIALEVSGSEFGRVAINSINQITKQEGRLALNI